MKPLSQSADSVIKNCEDQVTMTTCSWHLDSPHAWALMTLDRTCKGCILAPHGSWPSTQRSKLHHPAQQASPPHLNQGNTPLAGQHIFHKEGACQVGDQLLSSNPPAAV